MELFKLSFDPQGCIKKYVKEFYPYGGPMWIDGGQGCLVINGTTIGAWINLSQECSASYNFACEYTKDATVNCGNTTEILKADGNYTKTFKIIQNFQSNANASSYCKSIGMNLFNLTTDPQGCLAQHLKLNFPIGGHIWIDGSSNVCEILIGSGEVWRKVSFACSSALTFVCEYKKDEGKIALLTVTLNS
jgi:hypothetical protein